MSQTIDVTATTTLAEFLTGLRYEELPTAVTHAAKRALLDTLGAGIQGSTTEAGQLAAAAVGSYDQGTTATIWGTPLRATAPSAALVNGTAAHSRELDDFGGCGHSGAVVVPAALAVADAQKDVSGAELLTAIVAGYEVAARVTDAAGGYRAHNNHGWHSTGTCGSFGGASASAKLLELSSEQMAWAIGLAGTFTGGIWAFMVDGAMSKRLHPGKAAETGVEAAYLAHCNFTGPLHIFDAEWGGFLETYTPGQHNHDELTVGLGDEYRILRSGFKPYASCRGVHGPLDSLFQLQSAHGFGAEDVKRVTLTAHPSALRMVGGTEVRTVLDAQMSAAYGLAVALLSGDASLAQYTPERIESPEVREVMDRIEVIEDATLPADERPTVAVELHDGRRDSRQVNVALGDPDNPLSDEQLDRKFRGLAGEVFPEDHVSQIADTIWNLERYDSLADTLSLLQRSA